MKARVILRRNDDVLLERRLDETGNPFFRPIGGNIEFGESSVDAVKREFYEETHMHIHQLRLLGCIEDIRETSIGIAHEVCFLYEGRAVDDSIYTADAVPIVEDIRHYTAYWVNIREFIGTNATTLRPRKLLDMISKQKP